MESSAAPQRRRTRASTRPASTKQPIASVPCDHVATLRRVPRATRLRVLVAILEVDAIATLGLPEDTRFTRAACRDIEFDDQQASDFGGRLGARFAIEVPGTTVLSCSTLGHLAEHVDGIVFGHGAIDSASIEDEYLEEIMANLPALTSVSQLSKIRTALHHLAQQA